MKSSRTTALNWGVLSSLWSFTNWTPWIHSSSMTAVNGCIYGFTCHIMWKEACYSKSDPKVMADYFINAATHSEADHSPSRKGKCTSWRIWTLFSWQMKDLIFWLLHSVVQTKGQFVLLFWLHKGMHIAHQMIIFYEFASRQTAMTPTLTAEYLVQWASSFKAFVLCSSTKYCSCTDVHVRNVSILWNWKENFKSMSLPFCLTAD